MSTVESNGSETIEVPKQPVQAFFPLRVDPADDGAFEIGLVLGGTVSAGAYTAGVLDFLIEALDQWDKKKLDESDRTVPRHKVRLAVITGTSGGGILALLTARALHYEFPPASASAPPQTLQANPFYQTWVNAIDMTGLLATDDLKTGQAASSPVASLLSGTVLEQIAEQALGFTTPVPAKRSFLPGRLPLILTYSHLTGIPYEMRFAAAVPRSEYFHNHADYIRFSARYSEPLNKAARELPEAGAEAPDAIPLDKPSYGSWQGLGQYALGTSAFPVGLPARLVRRPATHYSYRYVQDSSGTWQWLAPKAAGFLRPDVTPAHYSFTSWDGGCTNNEPIELARQVLEGLSKAGGPPQPAVPPLPRASAGPAAAQAAAELEGGASESGPFDTWRQASTAEHARRALVLVDPFCQAPPALPPESSMALATLLAPTVGMFVQSNRFATTDWSYFVDPNVYDRYLITPSRDVDPKVWWSPPAATGGDALSGASLGGFMGFASRTFRHHDFMLGRYNCQAFLSWVFTLNLSNPVFDGTQQPKPAIQAPVGRLAPNDAPIIPLYGSAAVPQLQPAWPQPDAWSSSVLRKPVRKRANLLLMRSLDALPLPAFIRWSVKVCFLSFFTEALFKLFAHTVDSELRRTALLTKAPAPLNGSHPPNVQTPFGGAAGPQAGANK